MKETTTRLPSRTLGTGSSGKRGGCRLHRLFAPCGGRVHDPVAWWARGAGFTVPAVLVVAGQVMVFTLKDMRPSILVHPALLRDPRREAETASHIAWIRFGSVFVV